MASIVSMKCPQQPSVATAPAASAICIPDAKETDLLDAIDWSVMNSNSEEAVSLALLNVVELDQDEIAYMGESTSPSSADQALLTNDRAEDIDNRINCRKRTLEEENEERKRPAVSTDQQDRADSGADPGDDALVLCIGEHPHVSRRPKKLKRCSLPKRPLNAFAFFYHDERQKIVESMESSLSEDDIQRQVGKLWRHLQQDELRKYEALAENDKERYQKEMVAHANSQACTKNNDEDEPEENKGNYYSSVLPPPPPGVMVIPAQGGPATPSPTLVEKESGNDNGPGIVTPSGSWGYPSPVPSAQTSPLPRPDFRQTRVVTDPGRAHPSSWQGAPPPLPFPPNYHHPYQHHLTTRPYSPHFGSPARAAWMPVPQPHPPLSYCIPPGMELALPSMGSPGAPGQERKYRVTYRCYKMKPEAVTSFLGSLGGPHPPPAGAHEYNPYHHPNHPNPYQQVPPRW